MIDVKTQELTFCDWEFHMQIGTSFEFGFANELDIQFFSFHYENKTTFSLLQRDPSPPSVCRWDDRNPCYSQRS